MTRSRARALVGAAVLAPVLVLAGGVAFRDGTGGPAEVGAAAPTAAAVEGLAGLADEATVAALQERLRTLPADDASWASLGFAYVSQARASGDPSLYAKAAQAFTRSLEERPADNAAALAGRALLANARHDFAEGRREAQAALALDPYDPTAKGLLADALFELGEYDAGLAALQEMVDLRPGVPSLTRVSYAYELRGDLTGARHALERALAIAATPADTSFCLLHLAQLDWSVGDYDAAALRLAEGLQRDPSDVHLMAWRARVAAARGYTDAALRYYEQVVQQQPEPAYLVEYGELLESLGRIEDARTQYAVADATAALHRAADVLPDVELTLYEADHGDPAKALDLARAQREVRRSVQVEDALAWALHASGRDAEALQHAEAAQRLGTRNAMWDYHRGVIQAELGMVEQARASLSAALQDNPAFSPLHAVRARQALDALGPAA